MRGEEARLLLGFPPNSRLTLSQIKAAYRKKAWESHPDRFPVHAKPDAESKFKLISEAYNFLLDGFQGFPAVLTDASIPQIMYEQTNGHHRHSEIKTSRISARGEGSSAATYTRIVRTGVPNVHRGKSNGALIGIPFLLIVGGTIGIGAVHAYRAYEREKQAHPSHNPFLP